MAGLKLTGQTKLNPMLLGKELVSSEARYLRIDAEPETPDSFGDYEKAEQLAATINLNECPRIYARLSGKFIFGDLVEALFKHNNAHTERLIISTYSFSQENVDSLKNLLVGGYVDYLDILVSSTFYSMEYSKVKYAYKELDFDDRFQLAAAGTHDKLLFFKTDGGKHICMHGSANYRSSGSMEHVMIEDSEPLYNFAVPAIGRLMKYHKTIKKAARHTELWNIVTNSK